MEFMRLLQQRALRQIFQTRPFSTRQTTRQISSNTSISSQQCLRKQQWRSQTFPSTRNPRPRTPFPPSRLTKPTRRFHSTQTGGPTSAPEETLSLSQRMRKLSREYGYAAVGVYLALTALDLPFCYLAVSYLGTERIGRWEHVILSYIKGIVKWPMGEEGKEAVDEGADYVKRKGPLEEVTGRESKGMRLLEEEEEEEEETYVVEDHGYDKAEKADRGEKAGFWTKLALAYAIHKSFIFIRVPLTAAVTPKVVKTLRTWGWNIGKMPTKKVASGTGVNTGSTGVKSKK